jgi:hypothetical protein
MNEHIENHESAYSLYYRDTYHYAGQKAAAVLFGTERVAVKTWKQVFTVILDRCNQEHHEELMYLREKAAGKIRVFLSAKPDRMRRPVKIDEALYAESHYGSATLMHILRDRILSPAGSDYKDIMTAIR